MGVPLAAVLADKGYDVVGIQRRSQRSGWKIDWINKAKSTIIGEEPKIQELITKGVTSGRLRATDDYNEVRDSKVVIITIQTPIDLEKEPDLSHLKEACTRVGENLSKGILVCLESTVPPYTTENLVKTTLVNSSNLNPGIDFNLVFCYERVTPGHLIENLYTLPRVVGGLTPACTERGAKFYRGISDAPIYKTNSRTAEVSKLIENSHRDVNIAFANEAAQICQVLGVDFYDIREMINSLPLRKDSSNPYRNILEPGAGVGGHCLPKDPYLLLHAVQKNNTPHKPRLIPVSREINDSMPQNILYLISAVLEEAGRTIYESRIGVLGLSYKENIGDARNSPTLKLVELLDIPVRLHDPYIKYHEFVKTQPLIDTIHGSDCLVVMTKHDEYQKLELECISAMMRTKTIVDGRNLFNPEECIKHGFFYKGLGHVT